MKLTKYDFISAFAIYSFLTLVDINVKCHGEGSSDSESGLDWWLEGFPEFKGEGGGDTSFKGFSLDGGGDSSGGGRNFFPDDRGFSSHGGGGGSSRGVSNFQSGERDSDGGLGDSYSYKGSRHLCFELVAKFSNKVNPDGVKREVITVNDRFPGPTLRVRLGDTVTIRVRNMLEDSDGKRYPTSVHYHGIEMRGTPWWDGPELVTQCPIPYGGFMDYTFTLIQCGTYWWHAHTAWQYLDGFWGFLIVESNTTEVYSYDDELLMSVFDWQWLPGQPLTEIFDLPTTSNVQDAGITPVPNSALINGRGNADCDMARDLGFRCNSRKADQLTVFNVFQGWTYRLRLLNPSGHAAFNFSIEGHSFRVIEMDGVDTVLSPPVELLTIWPAQRYSLLITMNSTLDTDLFRIRTEAHIVAPLTPEQVMQLRSINPLAAIHYVRRSSENYEDSKCRYVNHDVTRGLNSPKGSEGGGPQGRPSCKTPPLLLEPVDSSYCQGNFRRPMGNIDKAQNTVGASCLQSTSYYDDSYYPNSGNNFNLILYDQTSSPPAAMTCPGDSPPEGFDEEVVFLAVLGNDTFGFQRWSLSNNISYTTDGVHVPAILRVTEQERVPRTFNPQYISYLNDIQVVLNNLNDGDHPFHLHGHTFWVIATGETGDGPYDPVRDSWKLRSSTAVRRDTTHVHAQSWLVLRFTADNPGTWLFHCHINWHLEHGLAAVFVEAAPQVVCKYQIPDETRRVCEANRVLVSGNNNGRGSSSPWSPYYGGTCSDGGRSGGASDGLSLGSNYNPLQFDSLKNDGIQRGRRNRFSTAVSAISPLNLNYYNSSRNDIIRTKPKSFRTRQGKAKRRRRILVEK